MERKYLFVGITIFLILIGAFVLFSGGSKINDDINGNNSNNNSGSSDNGNLLDQYPELKGDPDKVTVYFFWGVGCPHCADEKPFLEDLKQKHSGDIEVKMFEVYREQENAKIFQEVAAAYGTEARGVPATFIGEKNWVGFRESTTGQGIKSYIQNCMKKGCESPLSEEQ